MAVASLGARFTSTIKPVLIVDDDPLIARAMQSLLGRAGFRPLICRTAADALSRTTPGIAAAVVDIHLPDMNGLELSQQLRDRLGPDAPIFILSGDNSIDTIRQLPDAGATYFFAKPVNADILIQRIKEWTTGSPT